MTKYCEIIRLKSLNFSERNIALSCSVCNQLFEIERDLKHLSPEKRKSKRLELEKPILEAFWCWLENLNVLNGSALGKAVT